MPQQVGAERGQLRGAAQAGVEGRGEGEGELRVDGPAARDPNQSPGPDTPMGALLGGVRRSASRVASGRWTAACRLGASVCALAPALRLRVRAGSRAGRGREEDLP